ncbi:MAG: dihydropteroate synthase [Pseudomonadota bacterium]
MVVAFRETLAGLERDLADAGSAARLYLQPVGLVTGAVARVMIADGRACAVAGGPLAATAGEVAIRTGNRIRRIVIGMAELSGWAEQSEVPAAARLRTLLQRIEAPRHGPSDGPRLMGVVNVTPDSFSDGGEHLDPAAALAHCEALAAAGADILDIGGESTRPGAMPVSPEDEIARVRPVLEGLRERRAGLPGIDLSIDTRHADVMRAAIEAGIDIINDVTALTGEPDSLVVAATSKARIVLMHMQGRPPTMNLAPAYDDVALDLFDFLEARIEACLTAGIERRRLIVDPGIGFGKRVRENLEILRRLSLFHGLGCPILLGVSRKGLRPGQERLSPKERISTSLAAAMHALLQGVQMLRVHDVAETRQVIELWRRLADTEC